jgi:hypothetical protein
MTMSATLRYDIGLKLASVLNSVAGPTYLHATFGAYKAFRWKGLYRDRSEVVTFAISLPSQLERAMLLLGYLDTIRRHGSPAVRLSVNTLFGKLALSLGLPLPGHPVSAEEHGLLLGLIAEGLPAWLVYSDWLQEQDDESARRRSAVIREWSGKKAMKVKYGVLVTALSGRSPIRSYLDFDRLAEAPWRGKCVLRD